MPLKLTFEKSTFIESICMYCERDGANMTEREVEEKNVRKKKKNIFGNFEWENVV